MVANNKIKGAEIAFPNEIYDPKFGPRFLWIGSGGGFPPPQYMPPVSSFEDEVVVGAKRLISHNSYTNLLACRMSP